MANLTPLNLDEKHALRVLCSTDDTATIEAALLKCNERGFSKDYAGDLTMPLTTTNNVIVTVVEWQGTDYKWYWNGRGWTRYLNEAKTYDGEAALVASKSIGLSMSGSCYVSNLYDEVELAQIHAKATIAAEQARVARSLELRNELTQALDGAGISYVIPENTSAILVNVDGRGSVGISDAGYTAYIYNNDNCLNVTSLNDVIKVFRGNYGN